MTEHLLLKVYIAGNTPAGRRAIRNLEKACAEYSNHHTYKIEVIDILKHPQLAESENILATPTVVKELPAPIRRVVGDLSETEQLLVGLDLTLDQDNGSA